MSDYILRIQCGVGLTSDQWSLLSELMCKSGARRDIRRLLILPGRLAHGTYFLTSKMDAQPLYDGLYEQIPAYLHASMVLVQMKNRGIDGWRIRPGCVGDLRKQAKFASKLSMYDFSHGIRPYSFADEDSVTPAEETVLAAQMESMGRR